MLDLTDGPARVNLMQVLRGAVLQHTRTTPMSADDLLMVIGYFAGAAVAQAAQRDGRSVSLLRDIVVANLDTGILHAGVKNAPSVILPN